MGTEIPAGNLMLPVSGPEFIKLMGNPLNRGWEPPHFGSCLLVQADADA